MSADGIREPFSCWGPPVAVSVLRIRLNAEPCDSPHQGLTLLLPPISIAEQPPLQQAFSLLFKNID